MEKKKLKEVRSKKIADSQKSDTKKAVEKAKNENEQTTKVFEVKRLTWKLFLKLNQYFI